MATISTSLIFHTQHATAQHSEFPPVAWYHATRLAPPALAWHASSFSKYAIATCKCANDLQGTSPSFHAQFSLRGSKTWYCIIYVLGIELHSMTELKKMSCAFTKWLTLQQSQTTRVLSSCGLRRGIDPTAPSLFPPPSHNSASCRGWAPGSVDSGHTPGTPSPPGKLAGLRNVTHRYEDRWIDTQLIDRYSPMNQMNQTMTNLKCISSKEYQVGYRYGTSITQIRFIYTTISSLLHTIIFIIPSVDIHCSWKPIIKTSWLI